MFAIAVVVAIGSCCCCCSCRMAFLDPYEESIFVTPRASERESARFVLTLPMTSRHCRRRRRRPPPFCYTSR
uniref:Putative secreted protein n=1 Tax=Anopheles darlingi TaxID=43151 RepID=A0A2M4DRH3_ANODA